MITLTSDNGFQNLNLPTNYKDITSDVLSAFVSNINLSSHYCVVALCTKVSLFNLSISPKLSDGNLNVIPFVAKVGNAVKDTIKVGTKPIIDRTSIERGIHLPVLSTISPNYIHNFITNNKALLENVQKGPLKDAKAEVVLIQFKIVPETDIVAVIDGENKNNPFDAKLAKFLTGEE